MALPLIERGHRVHIIAHKIPSFYAHYFTFTLCNDLSQMAEAIRLHVNSGQFDVIHCHNEPSYFVTMVKEITDDIPVILDIHDSYLARSTADEAAAEYEKGRFGQHIRVTVEERNNFQLADALVFPGDHFRQVVTSEFKLEQPALTLPSYVPERFYVYACGDWHGGLVYEGKVNLPDETKTGGQTGFAYCDYTDLAKGMHAAGIDFHLYSGRADEKLKQHYQDMAFVHEPAVYEELMPKISRHDWGLVGNVTKTREWEVAMPNKLFEYMAAGVPIVAMNAAHCAELVLEHGIGIVVSGPEELAERWAEHRTIRSQLIKRRKAFSMNAHIHKLETFYRSLTNARE
jgi:transcription elongation factor Elf1